jgi:phosphatidylserine decarboxylase
MSNIAVAALGVAMALQVAAARKWCFRARIAARLIAVALALGVVAGYGGGALGWQPWLTGLVAFGVQMAAFIAQIAFLFYRDPERTAPADPDVLLSPADGEVIYIRRLAPGAAIESTKNGCNLLLTELADTDLARRELWQIGISMQFTDVHVNRSPIAGVVTKLVHTPGKFLSLRLQIAARENERQTILISGQPATVAVVQIASRLVRQIVSYVNASDSIARGQRIGIIRFGSQVDVLIPVDNVAEITTEEGDSIYAGLTIIGKLTRR